MATEEEKIADWILAGLKNEDIVRVVGYSRRGRRFNNETTEALKQRWLELMEQFFSGINNKENEEDRGDIEAELALRCEALPEDRGHRAALMELLRRAAQRIVVDPNAAARFGERAIEIIENIDPPSDGKRN